MTDRVRAKLFLSALHRQASNPDGIEIELAACTGEENKTWSEASPSASFRMTINNPVAAAMFRHTGQEFFVDFSPANPPPTSLADCDEFVLDEYYQSQIDSGKSTLETILSQSHVRCARCRCKKVSHDEPLRSLVIRNLGLA